MNKLCPYCRSDDLFHINTYKHRWVLCKQCGVGVCGLKKHYLFAFVPVKPLRRNTDFLEDKGKIYDYFVSESHKEYTRKHAHDFISNVIDKYNIEVKNKRILDISGGPGHFLNEFRKLGADIHLTEINDNAIQFANEILNIPTLKFDFDKDDISTMYEDKFDIILMGAAIMFCEDVPKFLSRLCSIIKKGGILIQHRSVVPTLGVLLRTQCDDYNYRVLYQPEALISMHEQEGFRLIAREDEIDAEMYVYDHDAHIVLRNLYRLYERPAVAKLSKFNRYPFRARDRRRSHMIFRHGDNID